MILLVAIAILAAGCGRGADPWGPVSGRVTFEDVPAPHMVVLYSLPARGIEMTAVTDDKGDFRMTTASVPGLPVGDYKVAIYPAVYETPKDGMMFDGPPPEPAKKSGAKSAAKKSATGAREFPVVYRDPDTSGLTATVTTGRNHSEFALKSNP